MNTIICAMNDLRLFTRELVEEIAYKVRRSTWRGVWAWFTEGSSMRLFAPAVIALYLAIEYGS